MKAWMLHGIGDFRFEEQTVPAVRKGEVLIRVRAVGICGSDIPRIYQTGAHCHPLIPGHEFSGFVVETGEGVECQWKGKRVGVFPLIPCGGCLPCQRKQYEMCRNYDYLGSRRNGGFGEYVSVPVDNLIELPEDVSYEAAAMLEPMAVAVHAMRRVLQDMQKGLKAEPEETKLANAIMAENLRGENLAEEGRTGSGVMAVCGLGTIGLLLVMFLLEAGRKNILVIGNKDFQKEAVLKMGIPKDCYCDSQKQEVAKWLEERTGGLGVETFFECVGKRETLVQAIDSAAPGGHICLVGNPYSDMGLSRESYWKILRNQLVITGTWNSSFTGSHLDDWHYVLKRLEENKVAPERLISHRFSLEKLETGFHIMRDKTQEYGKIMGIIE